MTISAGCPKAQSLLLPLCRDKRGDESPEAINSIGILGGYSFQQQRIVGPLATTFVPDIAAASVSPSKLERFERAVTPMPYIDALRCLPLMSHASEMSYCRISTTCTRSHAICSGILLKRKMLRRNVFCALTATSIRFGEVR